MLPNTVCSDEDLAVLVQVVLEDARWLGKTAQSLLQLRQHDFSNFYSLEKIRSIERYAHPRFNRSGRKIQQADQLSLQISLSIAQVCSVRLVVLKLRDFSHGAGE